MDMVVEALNGGHNVLSPVVKTESPNTTKKNRIIYDKEFLVECFKHPASSKKPSGFPLPNLECTLATARTTKTPHIVMNPKKKEDALSLRKEKESADSISLRPQSQSFASGCAANLTLAQLSQGSYAGRFQNNDDQTRNFFDREYPSRPTSSRFSSTKSTCSDTSDRGRGEKEKDREKDRDRYEERDHSREHDSDGRPGFRKNYGRGPATAWAADVDQSSGNNNRRRVQNGNANRFEREREHNRSDSHHENRHRNYRDKAEEEVPDWYSDGPTSRLETIELTGFKDDIRNEILTRAKKPILPSAASLPDPMAPKTQSNGFAAIDTAAMLSISYSTDEKNETEKPAGSSRFTDIFVRNSEKRENEVLPESEPPKIAPKEFQNELPLELQKPQDVHELEVALRNILFRDMKVDSRGTPENADFVKMIEAMSFKKQVQEEERFAEAAAGRKVEHDQFKAVLDAEARELAALNSEAVANIKKATEAQEQAVVRPSQIPFSIQQQILQSLPQPLQQFEQHQQHYPQQHHPQHHHPQQHHQYQHYPPQQHQYQHYPPQQHQYQHYPPQQQQYQHYPPQQQQYQHQRGQHGMPVPQMQGQFPPQMYFVPNQVRMGGYQQPPLLQRPAAPMMQPPAAPMMQPIFFMPTSVMRKMTAEQHVRQIIPTSAPNPNVQN